MTDLTEHDIYLFREGTHFRAYDRLGAHLGTRGGEPGASFAVWAPNAGPGFGDRRVQRLAAGRARTQPHVPIKAASGRASCPGHGTALATNTTSCLASTTSAPRKPIRSAYAPRSRRTPLPCCGTWTTPGATAVAGAARDCERAVGPHVGVRGAPGLLAPRSRGGQPVADLSRARARAGRLRDANEFHARGVVAGHGASILRLLGLSGHRLFRPHRPLRDAAGSDVPDRSPAPARHRRDPRLGALALPGRRAWAGLFRRHLSVRARRSAAGLPSRVEQLDLQLRPRRGAQLSRQQRAVLARPLPRRWPESGRRGLDALPGLRPARR